MKIQVGYIGEVHRDDTKECDRWQTIAENLNGHTELLLTDFVEWLNDCDDDAVTGYTAENLSELWFRII